jgi:hypothetical protein
VVFQDSGAWKNFFPGGARGITIGPIENAYHPGRGYGSPAYERTLDEVRAMGGTWVAITPFGRVADLHGRGIDLTFEMPFEENRKAIGKAIAMAHAKGLRVLLVPHLWVESGDWRGKINPGDDAGWDAWAKSYGRFLLAWAHVAETFGVDLLSVGVELRFWVTTARYRSFLPIVKDVRRVYHGPITYSANWDDVVDTLILPDLDVIGINAFFPLGDKDGASLEELREGGRRVRSKVHDLAETWRRPVVFTEVGYTTRPNPAIRPWEWPDAMKNVRVDESAQAEAYQALLAPVLDEENFGGFFVWRVYSDPEDVSQEAEWGFSPRGKLAELVVRDAFAAPWACDATPRYPFSRKARVPGIFP